MKRWVNIVLLNILQLAERNVNPDRRYLISSLHGHAVYPNSWLLVSRISKNQDHAIHRFLYRPLPQHLPPLYPPFGDDGH